MSIIIRIKLNDLQLDVVVEDFVDESESSDLKLKSMAIVDESITIFDYG